MSAQRQHSTSHSDLACSWSPDILGTDFSQHRINLGIDPDGEGQIYATLVRYNPSAPPATDQSRPAILWVHGMTDYFFQQHVAAAFADAGYAFYALDLRKCGRSHAPGQRWHYISDIRYYYAELNRSLHLLLEQHPQVIPCAHSTGGLIVALWLDHLRRTQPRLLSRIPAALFNSPWWHPQTAGVHPIATKIANPLFQFLGVVAPSQSYGHQSSGRYGQSLHASAQGRWEYVLDWKPFGGHTRYYGWLRAIMQAQNYIARHGIDIGVPALALFAEETDTGDASSSDIVLDVDAQISQAPRIGPEVTIMRIPQAIHDVSLSAPAVLEQSATTVLRWLRPRTSH